MRYLILLFVPVLAFAGPEEDRAAAILALLNNDKAVELAVSADYANALSHAFPELAPTRLVPNPVKAECTANVSCADGEDCSAQLASACGDLPDAVSEATPYAELSAEQKAAAANAAVKEIIIKLMKSHVRMAEEEAAAAQRATIDATIEQRVEDVRL